MFWFFRKFLKNQKASNKDLAQLQKEIEQLKLNYQSLKEELSSHKKELNLSLQKVGLVRYNPFNDVGGDQSFSLAVLNKEATGFVITSLYGRETGRVYAKPVKKGKSFYQLSEEEKQAIKKAIEEYEREKS